MKSSSRSPRWSQAPEPVCAGLPVNRPIWKRPGALVDDEVVLYTVADVLPLAELQARIAELPAFMPGGKDNPLGARALYLGDTLYRIHGTNEPWYMGSAQSSGCIRMTNDDVIDLYGRAKVGATVIVRR